MGWISVFFAFLCFLDDAWGSPDLLKKGDTAFSNGMYTEAVKLYTVVIEHDPKTPLLYSKRAAAYISLRQMSSALRDFGKALELDPSYVQGYVNRGKLHRQVCNVAAAKEDFNKALSLKPEHKTATKELEVANKVEQLLDHLNNLRHNQNWDGIRHAIDQLNKEAPDCVPVALIESEMALEKEEYEQVVAITGRLLKSDANNKEALVLRGKAYFYLYEHDMAKRHFGEALNLDPDYEPARKEFTRVKTYDRKKAAADAAVNERNWQEAKDACSSALHLDQKHRRANVGLWFGLCRANFYLKDYDGAASACANTLVLDSSHRDAKVYRIKSLMELERFDEAQVQAREAWQQHQGDHAVHEVMQEAEKRLKMSKRKDYYKILGIEKTASDREIKRVFRALAMKHHPDKVAPEEKSAAEKKFHDISEAYEVLLDEEKRARYDAGEDLEDQQGHPGQGHPFFHGNMGGGFHQQFHFQWG